MSVIVVINFLSPSTVPGVLSEIGRPFWKLKETITFNFYDLKETLNSKRFLVVENRRLEWELEESKEELLKTNLLERENKELKNLLGRNVSEKNILARVLSNTNQSPYETIIIDLGKNIIKKGSAVFSLSGILIGEVDEIYSQTARIKLLSAPANTYEVEIGEESISAIAQGLGGGNFEVRLPRGVDVKVGGEIISPKLLVELLGIVEYIESKPQNSFQKILFKIPVNINQLKWVLINNV